MGEYTVSMGAYTSTLLWDDVPPEQRETPAQEASAILSFSRAPYARIGDVMRPWLRQRLEHLNRVERGERSCRMATRGTYDAQQRLWSYHPCMNAPRADSDFCWRHQPNPGIGEPYTSA